MRLPLLLALALLAGCGTEPTGALIAADAAAIVVFGRGIADLGYSAVTGRDCSVVRLERGQTYCNPPYAPVPDRYCTRSLGAVDCWVTPALLPVPRAPVGDTPPPTVAQERYRAAPWPKSLTAAP